MWRRKRRCSPSGLWLVSFLSSIPCAFVRRFSLWFQPSFARRGSCYLPVGFSPWSSTVPGVCVFSRLPVLPVSSAKTLTAPCEREAMIDTHLDRLHLLSSAAMVARAPLGSSSLCCRSLWFNSCRSCLCASVSPAKLDFYSVEKNILLLCLVLMDNVTRFHARWVIVTCLLRYACALRRLTSFFFSFRADENKRITGRETKEDGVCIYARTLSLFCAEKKSFFFFLVRHLCPSAVFQKLFFSSFSKWLTGTNVEEGEEEEDRAGPLGPHTLGYADAIFFVVVGSKNSSTALVFSDVLKFCFPRRRAWKSLVCFKGCCLAIPMTRGIESVARVRNEQETGLNFNDFFFFLFSC